MVQGVVRPAAPEDRDVVGVADLHTVGADVVDLPAHIGVVEQVEDDRPLERVEDAVAPEAVRRDAARRAGHEVEPVRPRWPEQRAEVVRAEAGVAEEAVVERQLLRRVVRNRDVAVARAVGGVAVEAVHLAAVVLSVHVGPAVRRIRGAQRGELERRVADARCVRLCVTGRRPKPSRLHLRRVAVVVIERAVLLARDDQVSDRSVPLAEPPRAGGRRRCGPQRAAGNCHSRRTCSLQERAAGERVVLCHRDPPLSLSRGEGAAILFEGDPTTVRPTSQRACVRDVWA